MFVANWHQIKTVANDTSLIVGFVGFSILLIFGFRAGLELRRGPFVGYRHLFHGESLLSAVGQRYFKVALLGLAVMLGSGVGVPLLIKYLP